MSGARRRLHGRIAAKLTVLAALGLVLALVASGFAREGGAPKLDRTTYRPVASLKPIKHILVVYLENWSFDSLYGKFPGADGISKAAATATQVDKQGKPYAQLPQPLANPVGAVSTPPGAAENSAVAKPAAPRQPDTRFPTTLANGPFDLAPYVPAEGKIGDLLTRFYQEQQQIDGGKMDRFVSAGNSGGLPMGFYDATKLPLGQLAARFTLADRFFHGAFGGSMLNHFYLICGCAPQWPDAPDTVRIQLAPDGSLARDGAVTPDGYVVNTAWPKAGPHPAETNPAELMPPQTMRTIGDELNAKRISWAWYSGGWKDAVAGKPDALFEYNHQPFAYFARYANGTPGSTKHLLDESDLNRAVATGNLPSVSFFKPLGAENEHPGYADVLSGEAHAAALIAKVMKSLLWKSTAIIVAYDENGGFWDHVPPPGGDRFGPGTRVPAMVISPFAKRRHVDHTAYDTTSILALIEHRYGLAPLGGRDAKAADLRNAFSLPAQKGKHS